jgi:hypothetical protein
MSTETFSGNGGDNYSNEAKKLYLLSLLEFASSLVTFFVFIKIFTFVIEI